MKKYYWIILFVILAVLMVILSIRFLSGEDDWICQNGEWVKHGQPSVEKPSAFCNQ